MKKIFTGLFIAIVFVFGLWLVAVPDSLIIGLIENSIADSDTKIEMTGFKKGILFNFWVERIALSGKNPLLEVDNVRAKIKPLSLLLLRPAISVEGEMANGRISGAVELMKDKNSVHISVKGADISGIPFIHIMGVHGHGKLDGEMNLTGQGGELRFSVSDAKLEKASFSGVPIPLELFHSVKAAVAIGAASRVRSFALEGKDIYARLKGNIIGGTMDLQLELMPGASMQANPVFLTLEQYKVSPGYYLIPVKTRL